MATLQDYLGITALRDAWPKWKANVIAINNQVIAHIAGTADKHSAQDITYTGGFVGKTEVKAALDQAKTEIDTIVVNASIDPEVALARDSTVKGETFDTLDARLEESEQDLVSYKAETTTKEFYKELTNHKKRKPIMTIIDDDGRPDVYTKLKPIVELYNIPITSAVVTNRVGVVASMNLTQLKELKSLGFEFVSHAADHINLTTLTETDIRVQLETSKNWLQENGFNPEVIVYPYGGLNASIELIASQYFRCGVNIDNGSSLINYPPQKTYALERVYLDYGVALVKSKIDDAILNNGWLILGMHCFYPEWSDVEFKEVLDYAILNGIEIVSVSEGMDRVANLIDAGNGSIIDCEGHTYGGLGSVKFNDPGILVNSLPITSFDVDCISIGRVYAADASEFPLGKYGVLETHRFVKEVYSFQLYYITENNMVYKRLWNNDTSVWSGWELISSLIRMSTDTMTSSTLYDDVALVNTQTITVAKVTIDNQAGFPENKPGALTTNFLYGSNYSHQIYVVHITGHLYKRMWSGTAWGGWARIDCPSSIKGVALNVGVVNANGYKDISIASSGYILGVSLFGNPKLDLPAGLAYNCWVSADGIAKLRISNLTASNIDCGTTMDWWFKAFTNE